MKKANGMGSYYKLSGNRRKPFIVRKTIGWDIDIVTGRKKQLFLTIGYASTQQEASKMLKDFNENPYNIEVSKITFAEVYEKWSKDKFPTISLIIYILFIASNNSCTLT